MVCLIKLQKEDLNKLFKALNPWLINHLPIIPEKSNIHCHERIQRISVFMHIKFCKA